MLGLLSVTRLFAAPANDRIEKATVLSGTYSRLENLDLATATASPLDPLIDGASAVRTVWFLFQPAAQGTWTVEIEDFDGVRAGIFDVLDPENPSGSLRLQKQANNSAGGDKEVLSVNVSAGRRFVLVVGGAGKFHLTHRFSRVFSDFPATGPWTFPRTSAGHISARALSTGPCRPMGRRCRRTSRR